MWKHGESERVCDPFGPFGPFLCSPKLKTSWDFSLRCFVFFCFFDRFWQTSGDCFFSFGGLFQGPYGDLFLGFSSKLKFIE